MGVERKPIGDINAWMRNVERVGIQQARRRVPQTASDLLGPGFGPTATLVDDWNGDEAAFNGFFWAGLACLNSPDSTVEWCGLTVTEDDHLHGVQQLWSARDGDPVRAYNRRFTSADGVTRTYTRWRGDSGWRTDSVSALTPSGSTAPTLSSIAWQEHVNGRVDVNVTVTLTSAIAATGSGNINNMQMVQMPSWLAPSCPVSQGLTSGSSGPLSAWAIDGSGIISLTALPPGVAPAVHDALSVSGTYSL